MQAGVKRYAEKLRAEKGVNLQVRVGANTGEVGVRSITTGEGYTEYAPVGHSTGIAARVQALAPVGSIATTETVQKLCEGYSSSSRSCQPRSRELVKRSLSSDRARTVAYRAVALGGARVHQVRGTSAGD